MIRHMGGCLSNCDKCNKAYEYDGESYEVYDGSRHYDRHGEVNYYIGEWIWDTWHL